MKLENRGEALKEILEDFFSEADENLDAVEQDLIRLEAASGPDKADGETVARISGVLQNLKGSAGFLGLDKIVTVAQAGEALLEAVRLHHVGSTKPVVDGLLQANDALKNLLHLQKIRESDEAVDIAGLCADLERLGRGEELEEGAGSGGEAVEDKPPVVEVESEADEPEPPVQDDEDEEEVEPAEDVPVVPAVVVALAAEPSLEKAEKRAGKDRRRGDRREKDRRSGGRAEAADARLDGLAHLLSELTLQRNSLLRQVQSAAFIQALSKLPHGEAVEDALRAIDRVTREIQRGVVAAQLAPLAIEKALMVKDRAEGYAIPLKDISEVVKLREEWVRIVNGRAAMDLRGERIVLRALSELSGAVVNGVPTDGFVVVVRDDRKAVGLVVKELVGQEEVVLRPFNRAGSKGQPTTGATVSGSGDVHVLLDVPAALKGMDEADSTLQP